MTLFSLIQAGQVHLSEETKILAAKDVSLLLEAQDIVHRAEAEAARYRAQVELECEALKKEAYEKGFQEGLEHLNAHLIHFDKQLHLIRTDLQKHILPLALKAAQKIVAEQLRLFPETIVDIVMQALSPIVQNHRFTIYVNKADKEALDLNKSKIKEILEQLQTLIIADRADIAPGGCIIETESGIINATIENQWRALEAAFTKYIQS